MGTLVNKAHCLDCLDKGYDIEDAEIAVILEHMRKPEVKKEIDHVRCPRCGGDNWVMSDSVEH